MRKALIPFLAVFLLVGCPNAYTVAWQTLDSVQKAKALTASQLAEVARVKHADCIKAHGEKTPAYAECIKPTAEALKQWRSNIRPAINSAVNITATAVQIAEKAKEDPKLNWLQLLKPAICALSRAAKDWSHYFADKGAAILGAIKMIEGVTCND